MQIDKHRLVCRVIQVSQEPLWMSQPFEFKSTLNTGFFFIHNGICSFSVLPLGLRNNNHKATGHLGKLMFGPSTVIPGIYNKSSWPSVSVLKKRLCHDECSSTLCCALFSLLNLI